MPLAARNVYGALLIDAILFFKFQISSGRAQMKAKYDVLESEDHLFRVVPTSDLLAALVFLLCRRRLPSCPKQLPPTVKIVQIET